MEAGNWLPLLDRERFPSSVLSAILSAAALAKEEGPAKAEALAKEDAESKAAASRRTPKRQSFHAEQTAPAEVPPFNIPLILTLSLESSPSIQPNSSGFKQIQANQAGGYPLSVLVAPAWTATALAAAEGQAKAGLPLIVNVKAQILILHSAFCICPQPGMGSRWKLSPTWFKLMR